MTDSMHASRRLGCWFKPLLIGLGCIAAGVLLMDRWNDLSGPLKALSIMLVVFGVIVLLPAVLVLVFKLWVGRLKRTLEKEVGPLRESMAKSVNLRKEMYSKEQDYRLAAPEDWEKVDVAFYDEIEEALKSRGFRTLGNIVNSTLEQSGMPSPVMRIMVSSSGSTRAACYHLQMKSKSLKIVDLETEYTDGTFLATSNTAGLDLTTPPARLQRHQFEPGTGVLTMLDRHEAEHAKLMMLQRQSVVMQTLDEAIRSQKRLQAMKNEFVQSRDYEDPELRRRLMETRERAREEREEGPDGEASA